MTIKKLEVITQFILNYICNKKKISTEAKFICYIYFGLWQHLMSFCFTIDIAQDLHISYCKDIL